jgi:hypothetical protein
MTSTALQAASERLSKARGTYEKVDTQGNYERLLEAQSSYWRLRAEEAEERAFMLSRKNSSKPNRQPASMTARDKAEALFKDATR